MAYQVVYNVLLEDVDRNEATSFARDLLQDNNIGEVFISHYREEVEAPTPIVLDGKVEHMTSAKDYLVAIPNTHGRFPIQDLLTYGAEYFVGEMGGVLYYSSRKIELDNSAFYDLHVKARTYKSVRLYPDTPILKVIHVECE